MKYLFIFLILLPLSAQAQTFVSKDTANAYYANCVKTPPSQNFSQEGQQIFCACTAARMTQFFTMEDWQQIVNRGPKLREADNRMLVNVTAWCLQEPTRAYYYNTCISDTNTASYGNPQQICSCLGDAMGLHVQGSAPRIFAEALTKDPNIADPMVYLLGDSGFQQFARTQLTRCLK